MVDYNIGDIVEGVITGIQPYGAFVQLDNAHNGLLHISEISDDYIKDVYEYLRVREKIKVKILDVGEDEYHYKLSLKALNGHPKRIRKYNQYYALPKMPKGFSSIEEHLEEWIRIAKEEK